MQPDPFRAAVEQLRDKWRTHAGTMRSMGDATSRIEFDLRADELTKLLAAHPAETPLAVGDLVWLPNPPQVYLRDRIGRVSRRIGGFVYADFGTISVPGAGGYPRPTKVEHSTAESNYERVGTPAGQTGTWQPIEIHDKSSDLILVALIRGGRIWRVSDAQFNGLGYYSISGDACHWRTHWMPLPAAPTGTEDR